MSMVGCLESYYRVLAVDDGWSQDTIRRAYRKLAMRKEYSMEELRGMLAEMVNGFEIPDFSLAPGENWSTSDFPS